MTNTDRQKGRLIYLIWLLVGLTFIIMSVFTAGLSFFSPPTVADSADLAALYGESGRFHRPFAEVHFDEVRFTGLYLFTHDENSPTDWVMCGLFDGKYLLFYQPVAGPEYPSDMENVAYILRRPTASNHEQSERIYSSFTADSMEYNGLEENQIPDVFHEMILEADRNGLTVCAVFFVAGILVSALSVFLFIRNPRFTLSARGRRETHGKLTE